jgi:hypothetical protein
MPYFIWTDEGFPLHALPEEMRSLVIEVARVHQLPVELPGTMALAVVSAALGQAVFLDNPPHRTSPNLFALTPAASGTGKSESFRMVVRPLQELQARLIEAFADTAADLEAEEQLCDSKARGLRAGKGNIDLNERQAQLKLCNLRLAEIQKEKAPPRLIVEDATPPKLAAMLAARQETLAVFSSEAGDVVSNFSGRHNATGRTDETLFLKGFSLDPHTQDRVGTGSIVLRSPCLAVLLVCTPDEAAGLFDIDRFSQGGLLPRFLICAPETRWQHDDGEPRRPSETTLARWNGLVVELAEAFRLRKGEADLVRAEPEALEVLRAFNNNYASRFDELKDQAAFAARHCEYAAKLALVIHCAKHRSAAASVRLDTATMERALALLDYFRGQQEKMLAKGLADRREQRLADLLECLAKNEEGRATVNDLKRRNGFDPAEVERLAELYPKRLTVLDIQNAKGGRPSRMAAIQ